MEDYKKKLMKAQDGDKDAIKDLGVCTIPPKLVEPSPSLTWRTLKVDFKEIVAISFAAKILRHTFLLETTGELLKMLVYLTNFNLKIQVTPTLDKVL